MKNFIKLIINFFRKLFGIKTEENEPQIVPPETPSEDTVNSGNTEGNNGSDEPQITLSGGTEQEEEEFDCSKLIILPSNEVGDGGEITFKTNL